MFYYQVKNIYIYSDTMYVVYHFDKHNYEFYDCNITK